MPAESRGRLLDVMGSPSADADLDEVLERVTRAEAASVETPHSALWPVIGGAQMVVGAVIVFAVAWLVTLFVTAGAVPVGSVEIPILGPIPMPLALLVVAVLVGALLGWLLSLHASYVGRRAGAAVRAETESAVRAAINGTAVAGLDRVEEARRVIAAAAE